jgi:hypothetical protein
MFIYTARDVLFFGIVGLSLLVIVGAFILERILFWLERKKFISDKWRRK